MIREPGCAAQKAATSIPIRLVLPELHANGFNLLSFFCPHVSAKKLLRFGSRMPA
jgi:hypothetical protein